MARLEVRVDRERVTAGGEFAVTVAVPEQEADPEATSQFVLALDASGSMTWPARVDRPETGPKWDLARAGALDLVRGLDPNTQLHVVLFAGYPKVVASDRAGTLAHQLDALLPNPLVDDQTGTNLGTALTACYQLLADSTATSRRVIMLSDGSPSWGEMSAERLGDLARAEMSRDVYTDPIGFGEEADVRLLLGLSGTGTCEHVKRSEDAGRQIGAAMAHLTAAGQSVVAPGGGLRLALNPAFAFDGLYQIFPSVRILGAVPQKEPAGLVVTVPFGAVGAGNNGRPAFAIRLRAPNRTAARPVTVLKATGTLRTRQGAVGFEEAAAMVQPVAEEVFGDQSILDKIREAELAAQVNERLDQSDGGAHEKILTDALGAALAQGLEDLATEYEGALGGLRAGEHPKDVSNAIAATSSKSKSNPRTILLGRPHLDPNERRTRAAGAADAQGARPRVNDAWDEPAAARRAGPPGRRPTAGRGYSDDPDLTTEDLG